MKAVKGKRVVGNRRIKSYAEATGDSSVAMATTEPRKATKREQEIENARREGQREASRDAAEWYRSKEKELQDQITILKNNGKLQLIHALGKAIEAQARALEGLAHIVTDFQELK